MRCVPNSNSPALAADTLPTLAEPQGVSGSVKDSPTSAAAAAKPTLTTATPSNALRPAENRSTFAYSISVDSTVRLVPDASRPITAWPVRSTNLNSTCRPSRKVSSKASPFCISAHDSCAAGASIECIVVQPGATAMVATHSQTASARGVNKRVGALGMRHALWTRFLLFMLVLPARYPGQFTDHPVNVHRRPRAGVTR